MKEDKKKKEDVEWDKRKILLFLIAALVLLGIGFELKAAILGSSTSLPNEGGQVQGSNIQPLPSPPNIQGSVQNQINNLKTEAANINVTDIASSSPQVQKVINDLKALQDYPSNQIKSTCEQVCNGL